MSEDLDELKKEYFDLLKKEVLGKTSKITERLDELEVKIKELTENE